MGGGEARDLAGAAGREVKAKVQGRAKTRSVGMVTSRRGTRWTTKRLNNLLDPETRAEIVTENVSEYLRVS